MKYPKIKPKEINCPDCNGKGVSLVEQKMPGRRIYGPRCATCKGKGRITRMD
jgi:DnaJ-class molecular chaperone